MQTLYYVPVSSSLTLVSDVQSVSADYWYNVTSLVTSASSYQIVAFSGSTPIAYFPINNTNIYLEPFPTGEILPTSSAILGFAAWTVTANIYTTGSEVYLKDSSSGFAYFTSSVEEPNSGYSTLLSGSLEYYLRGITTGSYSYTASITINNITIGDTYTDWAIDTALTGTYMLNSGSADYQVTMSLNYYGPPV